MQRFERCRQWFASCIQIDGTGELCSANDCTRIILFCLAHRFRFQNPSKYPTINVSKQKETGGPTQPATQVYNLYKKMFRILPPENTSICLLLKRRPGYGCYRHSQVGHRPGHQPHRGASKWSHSGSERFQSECGGSIFHNYWIDLDHVSSHDSLRCFSIVLLIRRLCGFYIVKLNLCKNYRKRRAIDHAYSLMLSYDNLGAWKHR